MVRNPAQKPDIAAKWIGSSPSSVVIQAALGNVAKRTAAIMLRSMLEVRSVPSLRHPQHLWMRFQIRLHLQVVNTLVNNFMYVQTKTFSSISGHPRVHYVTTNISHQRCNPIWLLVETAIALTTRVFSTISPPPCFQWRVCSLVGCQ